MEKLTPSLDQTVAESLGMKVCACAQPHQVMVGAIRFDSRILRLFQDQDCRGLTVQVVTEVYS